MKIRTFATIVLFASCYVLGHAQTATENLKAYKVANTIVPFDVKATGKSTPVNWGMDTAWDDLYNVNWGVAHYGAQFTTGRISFQPYNLVDASKIDDASANFGLPTPMALKLQTRINHIRLTGTNNVEINCDHEALFRVLNDDGSLGAEQSEGNRTGYNNYVTTSASTNTTRWVNLIKATVKYTQNQGMTVVSVAPFNESDFGWSQYRGDESAGMARFREIAQALRNDNFFKTGEGKNVRICGGNTLNCDRALPWYNYLKDYIDEGNTHQLAGSFDNYAAFFTQVSTDGKVATADELHNVGEAIVGANYGMQNGIWWGFDAKARGQFMHDTNEGVQIAYGEDRPHWTSTAIYRNDKDHEIHGFIGTSERQANPTTYQYLSPSRDVFFNGYGPTRQWAYTTKGGPEGSYQHSNQTNQEILFDITYGEDVAPFYVDGNYQIMNVGSRTLLSTNGYWSGNNHVDCKVQDNSDTQRWHVYPDNVIGRGDCSYWFIDNYADASQHLNLLNGGQVQNLKAGSRVITYNAGHDALEQWYIRYAKDGYFYIMARQNNKYLYCGDNGVVSLQNEPTTATSDSELLKYKWRLMPIDAPVDMDAPTVPSGLTATPQSGSIKLSWSAVSEANISYTILRKENGEWNTIGRGISGTEFIDNTAIVGRTYAYKIMAVDYSGNRSVASSAVSSSVTHTDALLMHLKFDGKINDESVNKLDAAFYKNPNYSSNTVYLDGNNYAMIPYSVANQDQMTITMWVNSNNATAWQRVFDFGNDTDHYMFFTPTNGENMRFVMKNGEAEEVLEGTSALGAKEWKHVAIAIGASVTTLYIDGEPVASKSFTIKPSDISPILCYIGRSMYSSDPLFKGHIDDFRIYNYALSSSEVAEVKGENEFSSDETIVDKEVGAWNWTGEDASPSSWYLYNPNWGFIHADASNSYPTTDVAAATLFTIAGTGTTATKLAYKVGTTTYYLNNSNGTMSINTTGSNLYIRIGNATDGYYITTYSQTSLNTSGTGNNRYLNVWDGGAGWSRGNGGNKTQWRLISSGQMQKYNQYQQYSILFEELKDYANNYILSDELMDEIRTALTDKPEKIDNSTDIESLLTELSSVCDRCREYILSVYDVLDMTSRIINPGFESTTWNEGWTTEGFLEHANEGKFGGKHIAEMYLYGTDSPTSGKVEQTLMQLPSGRYSMSATATGGVGGDNLYVKIGTETIATPVPNTNDSAEKYEVTFTLFEPTDVTIGFARVNSGWWSAVDDFTLTLEGAVSDMYVKSGTYSNQYVYTEHEGEFVAFGRGANWGTQAIPTNEGGIPLDITISNYVAGIKYTDTNLYLFDAGGYNIYTDKNSEGDQSTRYYLEKSESEGYKFVLAADVNYAIGIGKDGDFTTLKLVPTDEAPVWRLGDDKAMLSVSAEKYGTFAVPYSVPMPQGVEAYTCQLSGDIVELTAMTSPVEEGLPVILKNTTEQDIVKYYYGNGQKGTTSKGMPLVGLYDADQKVAVSSGSTNNYVLQTQGDKQAFYKVTGVSNDGKPFDGVKNRCYLTTTTANAAKLRIAFSDGTETSIEELFGSQANDATPVEYYSTGGQKLNAPQRGINIVRMSDGSIRKVMMK